jgi:hypothetical protein
VESDSGAPVSSLPVTSQRLSGLKLNVRRAGWLKRHTRGLRVGAFKSQRRPSWVAGYPELNSLECMNALWKL